MTKATIPEPPTLHAVHCECGFIVSAVTTLALAHALATHRNYMATRPHEVTQ